MYATVTVRDVRPREASSWLTISQTRKSSSSAVVRRVRARDFDANMRNSPWKRTFRNSEI